MTKYFDSSQDRKAEPKDGFRRMGTYGTEIICQQCDW